MHTKPGVQKQPANTHRIADFLIIEYFTGYNLLHHLGGKKTSGKSFSKNLAIPQSHRAYLFLPFWLDPSAVFHHHVAQMKPLQMLRGLRRNSEVSIWKLNVTVSGK